MDIGVSESKPHRFTVAEYYRMTEAGLFAENSRVELIRGEIIDMAAIGTPHFVTVNRLTRLLVLAVGDRGIVSVQNPLRLDDSSEPEPDIVVFKAQADEYESGPPTPDDALLVIEVADTSLAYDRFVKAPLYAESGIADYWIVNVQDRTVEVYRTPAGGRYADVRTARPGDMLTPLLLPGVALPVADVLRQSAGGWDRAGLPGPA